MKDEFTNFYIRKGGVPEGNLGSPRKIDFQNKFKHRNQNNISI